ncbi:glycosyltransferase 87 family protein, partial [Saccharomonospora iraqiensis]|uniref:glycosyltransferase 87 family protein n=1 Tax=Saccharomonospora iraqiensis TaxID=52698 RepID=UPI00022E0AF3
MVRWETALRRRDVGARDDAEAGRHGRAVTIALGVLLVTAVAVLLSPVEFSDLRVYRTGGYAWSHGIALYSPEFREYVPLEIGLPFLYPPLAAVAFVPAHLLPWHVATVLLVAAGLAALLATTTVVAGRRHGRRTGAVLLGAAVAAGWLLIEPVRQTIVLGQINLLLMGLVVVDCLLPRTRWPRGLLTGLAAGIKLTPLIFVLFFLVKRQYRAAAVAVGTFAGSILLGFALAPGDSVRFWFDAVFGTDQKVGTAYAFNQSFNGVLHRLLPDGGDVRFVLWVLLVLAFLAVALLAARRARSVGDDVTVLLAIAFWGLLASPLSWSHHWVWVAPAAVALAYPLRRGAARRWWVPGLATLLVLAFVVGPHGVVLSTDPGTPETAWAWWQHLAGSSYTLVAVAALLVLAVRRRTVSSDAGASATAPPEAPEAPG